MVVREKIDFSRHLLLLHTHVEGKLLQKVMMFPRKRRRRESIFKEFHGFVCEGKVKRTHHWKLHKYVCFLSFVGAGCLSVFLGGIEEALECGRSKGEEEEEGEERAFAGCALATQASRAKALASTSKAQKQLPEKIFA